MGKIVQLGWTRPISFLEDLRVTQVQMRSEVDQITKITMTIELEFILDSCPLYIYAT